jgi:hypothetical protein
MLSMLLIKIVDYAPVRDVAQLVERLVWDQEAASSSPAVPTIFFYLEAAQLVERLVWDYAAREAPSPAVPTIRRFAPHGKPPMNLRYCDSIQGNDFVTESFLPESVDALGYKPSPWKNAATLHVKQTVKKSTV